jgi:O-antigen/teichoic acid export membrane protein
MGNLKKGVFIYLITNILNASIPFALLPILTRYLAVEEYGAVSIFQSLINVLVVFCGVTFVGAINRNYFDKGSESTSSAFLSSGVHLIFLCFTISLIVVVMLSGHLSELLGIRPDFIVLALLVSLSNVLILVLLGQWQVRNKAKLYGVFQISHSTINMLLSVISVVILGLGVDGRIGSQVISGLVFSLIAFAFLFKNRMIVFKGSNSRDRRELLNFGVPLFPHVVGGVLLNTIDRLIIGSSVGLGAAGVYMLAFQIVSVASIVFDAVNKALLPWLFRELNKNDLDGNRRIVVFTYAWYALILCGAFIGFYVGPYLVTLIAGDAYIEAGSVIGILALGQAFKGMYLMVTNYCFYAKETKWLSLVSIISGVLNVLLLVYFVDIYGVIGAAYAYCTAMAIRFFGSWYVAHKSHAMPWFNFLAK